ncbi:MAG: DegT/DnrJ/EryC1/StrS family aminotransferase, partial [Candidatus Paceibacteria bacterium]
VETGWLAFPFVVRDDAPFTRTQLQRFLEARNIQTRVIFTGNITRQPGFSDIEMRKAVDSFSNADRVMRGGILIGCHQGMTNEMIDHLHNSIDLFVEENV